MLQILGVVYLVYAIWITSYLNNKVNFYRKLYKNEPQEIKQKYCFLSRDDCEKWNKLEMIICGIFLLPIRIVLGSLSFFCCNFGQFLVILLPRNRLRVFISRWWHYITLRSMLFMCGYHSITFQKHKVSDYLQDYPEQEIKDEDIPVIIGNHVGFTDGFFTIMQYACGFIGKAEVQNNPFMKIPGLALDTIWVNREDRLNKNLVLDKIKERIKHYQNGNKMQYSPLLIYPEGTTSNGKYVMDFKQGAFVNFTKIKVICLDYTQQKFINILDNEGELINIVLMLCQFHNRIVIKEFNFDPEYLRDPSRSKYEQWPLYAKTIRQLITKACRFKSSDKGLKEVKEYQKIYSSGFKNLGELVSKIG